MRLTLRLVFFFAVLAAGPAVGWYSPILRNVCNSAPAAGESVLVNVDCVDSINPLDELNLKLFYSTDNQGSWHEVALAAVNQPGFDNTYQCRFPLPGAGTVHYYVRGENGTNYGTQSPYNSGDAWPVTDNLLASLAVEGTGDTINDPDGAWLDLTGAWMGYSNGKFYGCLTNHYTSWPTRGSIIGPWYLYSVGFRNSEAATGDTLAYAMTHVSILTYTDGLYEVNTYTHDFTKIGNIDIQTSGNRLIMRCNLSDLVARPHFQPWPNQCGYLCSAKGETRSADISLNSWQHDTTNSSRFYVDRTPRLVVGQNTPPVVNLGAVEPDTGTGETDFRFHVHYVDADTNVPVLRSVVVDADTFDLVPGSHRYAVGVTYTRTLNGFGAGPHEYRFVFDDGFSVVTTPPDTFFVTGTAVAEVPNGDAVGLSALPNPFSGSVRFHVPFGWRVLRIFDRCGKLVRSLSVSRPSVPGPRSLSWDGTDKSGRLLPAGIYFLREEGGPLRRLLVKLNDR
jgi:hypothetical protein